MKERTVADVAIAGVICALAINLTSSWVQTNTKIPGYGLISARDYYIDPSVTDFRATINNIIQNAVTPAKIHLAAGTYTLLPSINNFGKNDIEIAGAGMGQTIIVLAPNQANCAFMLRFGTASSNWYIHDLTLDGNGSNQGVNGQTAISIGFASGTPLAGLSNSLFERVEVRNLSLGGGTNTGKSYDLYDCSNITIRYCKLTATSAPVYPVAGKNHVAMTRCSGTMIHDNEIARGSNAINFYQGTHDSYAVNNTCTDQGNAGIVAYRSAWNNRASGNTISNSLVGNTEIGMYIAHRDYPSEPCYNNIFDNNTITNVQHGIWLNPASYQNKVFYNTITCSSRAIVVFGHDNEIDGNVILQSTVGIFFGGDSALPTYQNRVAYNKISNSSSGIYFSPDYPNANNNIVEANEELTPMTAWGILIASQAPCDSNRFSANLINSNSIALRIGTGATNTIIEPNTFMTSTTIQDLGVNTTYPHRDYTENPIPPIPTLPPLPNIAG